VASVRSAVGAGQNSINVANSDQRRERRLTDDAETAGSFAAVVSREGAENYPAPVAATATSTHRMGLRRRDLATAPFKFLIFGFDLSIRRQ
jgi:hypothetical protein